MKRIVLLSILALIVVVSTVRAQPPQRMSYQSVLRDNANQVIASKQVRLRVSMLADSMNATPVYTETHQVTTNAQGLIQLEIGGGTVISGSYAAIPWSRGRLFIKTDIDPAGGTNYTLTSTTQLLSVPYAQYAGDLPVSKSGDTVRIGNAKLLIPGSVLLSSGTGNAPATLSEGLVAYYPFNGNANDESGNGNHGVVNGAKLTTDRFDSASRAYDFNVSNWTWGANGDHIYIPYNPAFNFSNFSISSWVRTKSKGSSISPQELSIIRRFQYGYNPVNGESWILSIGHGDSPNKSNLMGYVIQQSPSPAPHNVCSTASTVSIGAWTHILMIYENSTIKLYINGSEVCSSYKPSITINTTGNSGISIGLSLQANGNWGPFDGKIDDIRIYNRALNQSEITYLSKN